MDTDVNFLGLERYPSVMMKAIRRLEEENEALNLPGGRENLCFLCEDAEKVSDFFAEGEISWIYLNFSDPWPKERHASRRLTSSAFLKRYRKILSFCGHVEFKTDNRSLFDWSIEEIQREGWNLLSVTYDLHHAPEGLFNVMTEYEEKFSSRGQKICKLTAKPRL